MKKIFTLFVLSLVAASTFAEVNPLFVRPDSAYASSMYINPDSVSHLYPLLLISPALPEVATHPAHPDTILTGVLSEESTKGTHPISVGGSLHFGAWHSAPFGKTNPMTGETFDIPVQDTWVVLTFEEAQNLDSIVLWNIHQVNGGNPSNNEVKEFTVDAATTLDGGGDWKQVLATSMLSDNTDAAMPSKAELFKLTDAMGVKYVRINVDSNYGHGKNAGLAEVRFIRMTGSAVNELASESAVKVSSRSQGSLTFINTGNEATYKIYNLSGVLVEQGKLSNSISEINIKSGIYVVSIMENNNLTTEKVLVK